MDKKLLTKIVLVLIAIALIMRGIDFYLNYEFEKEKAETESNSRQLLETALEKSDVSYCDGHSYKLGCVVQVGRKSNNEGVCEQAYGEEPVVTACKASILRDKSLCANLAGSFVWGCEAMYDTVLANAG